MLEYFLDPYTDELLYSVWARFSTQVQYPNRGDVTQELFGSRSYRALIDWSCSLGYLVSQLPANHCYTVDTLINDHTLFPLYAPFLSLETRNLLRDQMIAGNGTALCARLGILASHISHHKWLRFCPECVKIDRDRLGETYWHRLHQAPGAEVCPIHITFLENSTVSRQSEKRSFVSAESAIHAVHPHSATNSPLCSLLVDVAECIDQLLHCGYAALEPSFLKKQYFALLEHHGFITNKGSLRVVEFLKALADRYPPSFLSLLHCEINRTRHIEAEWPARLPFARRSQHPLHHILVIRSLDTTIESFLSSTFRPSSPFGEGPWPCLNPVCEHYRQRCIPRYSTREKSRKGHPVGIFTCTCGFTYSRVGPDKSPEDIFRRDRIPSYGPQWQRKLCELWYDLSISKGNIARRLGVDFNTMTRQAKGLALPPRPIFQKASSRKIKVRKNPAEYRKEWLKIVEEHPGEGITALVRRGGQVGTIYNWLNKHDREWLLSHRPLKKMPQKTKAHLRTAFRPLKDVSGQTKREERDAATSQTIRLMAHQITNAPEEPKRVTRAQLEKAVPSVGWLLSNPNDFPLTAQAFQETRETREAFALRRIQWALQRYQKECIKPTRQEFISLSRARRVLNIPAVQEAIEKALAALAGLT